MRFIGHGRDGPRSREVLPCGAATWPCALATQLKAQLTRLSELPTGTSVHLNHLLQVPAPASRRRLADALPLPAGRDAEPVDIHRPLAEADTPAARFRS